MTRLLEHLRRRLRRFPPRLAAVAIAGSALFCALYGLFLAMNLVLVTDSDGSRQMLFTTAQDPRQLMALSGTVLADGGEPSPDFARHLSDEDWHRLSREFLLT